MISETDRIRQRYAKRRTSGTEARYSPLNPYVSRVSRERDAALVRWVHEAGLAPVEDKTVLEIGCGNGSNLLRLIQLGFLPENLVGNELLVERAAEARHCLPESTRILLGDAVELALDGQQFDVVFQSTVFSSILEDEFQERLASRMWSLAKPGGGVLWYDFVYNNPANPDVRGICLSRVRELFPMGRVSRWRLTLAPPIGRRIAARAPWLFPLLNALPFLRTHVLCWITKDREM